MYYLLCDGLETAQKDPEIIFTVFSGAWNETLPAGSVALYGTVPLGVILPL